MGYSDLAGGIQSAFLLSECGRHVLLAVSLMQAAPKSRKKVAEKNETRISEKTPAPEPVPRIFYHGIARRHGRRHDLDGSRAAILYAGLS